MAIQLYSFGRDTIELSDLMSGRRQIVEVLRDDTEKLDELYFQLGDVLDVKASIILVLVTLLGAVSGQVLALHGTISGTQIPTSDFRGKSRVRL